jgi:hypothetical protein
MKTGKLKTEDLLGDEAPTLKDMLIVWLVAVAMISISWAVYHFFHL